MMNKLENFQPKSMNFLLIMLNTKESKQDEQARELSTQANEPPTDDAEEKDPEYKRIKGG